MAIIKCKMCGGDLEIAAGVTVAECEYCGTKQTLPKANDEVVQNLFNRANNLRIKCEFDKAEQIYEKILQENDAESEAHWGIVLCKYGIEYVEDPKTFQRIPTCHRTSYDAVTTDADYLAAIEHADAVQKGIYEAEAKAIDAIQKDILNIVKNEKPFDVFICYKETDENGKRTQDSVIANDIYYQLTQEGLKVFYAAITLEDKLGQEYEPYIFAALNSAKVMLVIGTKPQYFSAVWVKNEWSRFLKLMKADRSKLLIPCYRDIDAYDLPEEFSHLQAQDMSKIGFINDVVRGIKKVTVKDEPKTTAVMETVVAGNASTAPLLKRAFMFLEDGDWDSANEYCEKVLDLDPECAEAYVGKLMAELQVKKQDDLKDRAEIFDDSSNYQKAIRFADEDLKSVLTGYIEHINVRNANARLEDKYSRAITAMNSAQTEDAFLKAADHFAAIGAYKDAETLTQECRERAECARKNEIYSRAKGLMQSDDYTKIRQAIPLFESIPGWLDADALKAQCPERVEAARKDALYKHHKKIFSGFDSVVKKTEENWKAAQKGFESISGWKDADALAQQCVEQIEKLKEEQAEREHKKELARIEADKQEKKRKKITLIAVIAACVALAILIIWATVIHPNSQYNDAVALMNEGKYAEAIVSFEKLGDHKDSKNKIDVCQNAISDIKYNDAIALMEAGKYEEASVAFEALSGHKDSKNKIDECKNAISDIKYNDAIALMSAGKYEEAISIFETLGDYKESADKAEECKNIMLDSKYNEAIALMNAKKYAEAAIFFGELENYKDATKLKTSLWDKIAVRNTISLGGRHAVGLKTDGTVVAVGRDPKNDYGQTNVGGWGDIVAISAGQYHTVGLRADGTVCAVGENGDGQCNVSSWNNIVAISTGFFYTVGLKADGTVVAVGRNGDGQCDVGGWSNIVAISSGPSHAVGLKTDGTVVAVGQNDDGQCDVGGWSNIIAISAGNDYTIGLKADGTVVAVGTNDYGECNVGSWSNIVAISAGDYCTVGLKSNGTVIATGYDGWGQCDVDSWRNIVAISAGSGYTIGLKANGTIVAIGQNEYGRSVVAEWKNIKTPQ